MPRAVFRGGFDVVIAAWPAETDARTALTSAAAHDPTCLCEREARRPADPLSAPRGWHSHPLLQLRGVHRAGADGIDAVA